jgi:hypothetical protein
MPLELPKFQLANAAQFSMVELKLHSDVSQAKIILDLMQ